MYFGDHDLTIVRLPDNTWGLCTCKDAAFFESNPQFLDPSDFVPRYNTLSEAEKARDA